MFAVLLLLIGAAAVMMVERFGPYYWDYWKMKEVTKTAALQWKVYSRKAAEEKLRSMLDDKEIAEYIEPNYCQFEDRLNAVAVYCSWEVDVYYPFSDNYRTMAFATEHVESVDGT